MEYPCSDDDGRVHNRLGFVTLVNLQSCISCVVFMGSLKVNKFQKEYMKSLFLPKYEQKIVRISTLCSEGRNPDNFMFVLWEK